MNKTPKNGLKAVARAKWEAEQKARKAQFIKSVSKENSK